MTGNTTNSPKDGAQRKREHDRRKREQGLKEFRAWVTIEEAQQLRECLTRTRSTALYGAKAGQDTAG